MCYNLVIGKKHSKMYNKIKVEMGGIVLIITKEEMIKKYASNEFEKNYIAELGDEVYEQVADTIDFMEGDGNYENISFNEILEQALVVCVHTYDFVTFNLIEEKLPNASYTVLHYKEAKSDWDIKMDNKGDVSVAISMSDEHYIIMSLLETLEELTDYMFEQGVANNVTFVNNTTGATY